MAQKKRSYKTTREQFLIYLSKLENNEDFRENKLSGNKPDHFRYSQSGSFRFVRGQELPEKPLNNLEQRQLHLTENVVIEMLDVVPEIDLPTRKPEGNPQNLNLNMSYSYLMKRLVQELLNLMGSVKVMQEYIFERRPFQMVMFSSLKCDGEVPEEGSELFINNIPKDVDILELKNYFEEVAKLYEIKLMVLSHGENRGFAYVRYWTKDDAMNAIKFLRLIEFRKGGVYLNIKTSFNNRRIFLGNIPTTKTKDDLWKTLNIAGYGNIVDVIMYKSYNNYCVNRGYAFVEFKSHEVAARFRAKTVNRLKLWGRTVIVDWAVPYPEPNEETMKHVKKIFLRNLDVLITTKELHRLLCTFIVGFKIEKVYKFKNYAFIHLETRKDAENLFKKLVDHYKDTGVEVEWAKPQSYLTTPEYRQSKVQGRGKVWNHSPQSKRDIVREEILYSRHLLGDLLDELNK